MAGTMFKRKAHDIVEQQEAKGKRCCGDNGIRYSDVKAFFEGTPSEDRPSDCQNFDDSETISNTSADLDSIYTELSPQAWCNLTGITSQSLSSEAGLPSEYYFRAYPHANLITSASIHRMVTRTMKRMNTYNKVLNTGELLEKIIFELPPLAIVNLRRVNRTWKHIIMTLPCIRKKIFLDAEPMKDTWIFDNSTDCLRPYTEELDGSGAWASYRSHCTPAMLNPMLFTRDDRAEQVKFLERARLCERIRFTARPDMQIPFESIYHDMFVTQPPVKLVKFDILYHDRDARRQGYRGPLRCSGRMVVERGDGVMFRDLLEDFERITSNATAAHYSTPRNFAIKFSGVDPEKKSTIYMLGAIFVTDAEKAAVEAMNSCEEWEGQQWPGHEKPSPPSPQAKALIKENCGKAIDFRPKIDRLQDELSGLEWYQRRDVRVFGAKHSESDD